MEGITGATIFEDELRLEIVCDESVSTRSITSRFLDLINNPPDGSFCADPYRLHGEGDCWEITYGNRKQAFVLREGNSIHIQDDREGVGIIDLTERYEDFCRQHLGVTPRKE